MERFTHPDCAARQHGCRFNAAPKWSKILLLLFFSTLFSGVLSAQCSYSFSLETAAGTPLLGTDAGNYSAPDFVDIDGDGLEDMVVGNDDGQLKAYIRVLPITNPVFIEIIGAGTNPFDGIDVGSRATPAFVDIDADGDADLFVGNQDGTFSYFWNDNGTFVSVVGAGNPLNGFDAGSYSSPAFGDLDDDGDFDLATGRNGSIRIYENIGTAQAPDFSILFTTIATGSGNIFSPALSDIDHDGDLDVVAGNSNGNLSYFRNNGASFGSFTLSGVTTPALNGASATNNNNSRPAFTDMDGDEDMDIAVGVRNGRFRFLRNTSCANVPTLTCSPDITVELDDFGAYELTLTDLSAVGTATCGVPAPVYEIGIDGEPSSIVVGGPLLLDCMDFPGVTVMVEARDACNGRSAYCYVDVTIEDNIAPEAKCIDTLEISLDEDGLADIFAFDSEVYINGGEIILTPWDINDGSLDNCDESFLSFEFDPFTLSASFDCSDIGVSPGSITMVVIDDVGNEGRCETALKIADNTEPTIPAIASRTIDLCQIQSGAIGNFVANGFHGVANVTTLDNCGVVTVSSVPADPSGWTTPGTYTINWTFNDGHGNSALRTQSVQVVNNAGPVLNCPANVSVNSTDNSGTPCGNTATFAAATFDPTICNNDAITSSLTSSHVSGARFPEGTTIVTYLAYDNAGNSGFCTFTVTVTEPPVITGTPGNISVNAASGQCGAVVTWTVPTPTDDCSMPTLTGTHQPNTFFNIGNTVVTYTATDGKGNTATSSFTVTVVDNQAPSLTCPPPIQVNNQPGNCFANVFTTIPTPTDNCPNNLTLTTTRVPAAAPLFPNRFPVGVTTITHTASDGANPSVSCSYTVTVRDSELPVWNNCPASVVLPASGTSTSCTQAYSWASPTATDNCAGTISGYTVAITGAGATVSTTTPSGSSISHSGTFREGSTTITYTATDNATPTSNTAVCSFTIQVRNTTPPVISCGSSSSANPVLVDVSTNQCYLLFNGSFSPIGGYGTLPTTAAESADCDPGKLTYTFNSTNAPLVAGSTQLALGEHVLRARSMDISGNLSTATCLITLRVRETQPPTTANCPANRTENASSAANTCGVTLTNLPAPSWTDNCANANTLSSFASVTRTHTGGPIVNNFYPLGVTTVVHSTRDGAAPWGNVGICTYTITVVDNTNPTVNCPAPVTLNTDAGVCTRNYSWTRPSATDNCGINDGTWAVTVTNPGGGTSTASSGMNPSYTFQRGVSTVNYTVNDVNGRTGTCAFTVTVNDGQGPSFTGCPNNLVQNITGCTLPANSFSWLIPVATDNCDGLIPNTTITTTPAVSTETFFFLGFRERINQVLNPGDYTIRYTATDNAGNTGICSFVVSVREVTPPVFSNMPSAGVCPPATVAAGPNCATVITANMLSTPVATDNCPGAVNVVRQGSLPGTATAVNNSISVIWRATDASGNTSECSQTVTVRDQTPPTINCHSSAGSPIVVNASPNQPCLGISPNELFASNQWIAPTSTDNCAGSPTPVFIGNQPSYYPIGVSQLVYRASDNASPSNSATCIVYLQVVESDVVPPSITCPNNVTVNANPATCVATNVNLGNPNTSDTGGCSNNVSVTNNAPSQYNLGTTAVTWTITDGGGNTAVCVQTVLVNANAEVCNNGIDDDCNQNTPDDCGGNGGGNGGGGNGDLCQIKLLSDDGIARDSFGFSGVLEGNIAVIGAPRDETGLVYNRGAVYVYDIDAGGAGAWGQINKLTASDGAAQDLFGFSLDFDGSFLVVGAPANAGKGAAYIFNSAWSQVAKLTAPDGVSGDQFGHSVSIDGNFLVVGAPLHDLSAPVRADAGAAYLFQYNGSSWVFLKKLSASDALTADRFGFAVDLDGEHVVAGAPLADPSGVSSAGAAYVFRQDMGGANNWGQQKKLTVGAPDAGSSDEFGASVSVSGTRVAVGAYKDSHSALTRPGAVFVYDQAQGGANNWGLVKKIIADDPLANDQFGYSIDLDGEDLLIGSRFDDDLTSNSGSAYWVRQNEGGANNYGLFEKIWADDGTSNDNFGQFVSVSDGIYLVGSVRDDVSNNLDQGSAYILGDCAYAQRSIDADETSLMESSEVRCLPNPVRDLLTIEVQLSEQSEDLHIMVTDATGRMIEEIFHGTASGYNRFQWASSRFEAGMYFVKVESAGIQETAPVVLMK